MTRFGCGGYSIGVGTSHSLFDGPAVFDFLSAWASNTTMVGSTGLDLRRQHNPVPVHDRATLLSCMRRQPATGRNPSSASRVAAIEHLYQLIKQAAASDWNHVSDGKKLTQMGSSSQDNFVLKTFHLSVSMIESLKRKILGEKRGSLSCSSFEVVAAHLWKVYMYFSTSPTPGLNFPVCIC